MLFDDDDEPEAMYARCCLCRSEFTESQLEGATECPACGTQKKPMLIADDVTVSTNWRELRVLCLWAENWAKTMSEGVERDEATELVEVIAAQLQKQSPEKAPLTMAGELQALANQGMDIELHSGGEVRKFPGKKPN